MRAISLFIFACAVIALSGCISAEQREFNRQQAMKREQQQREVYRENLARGCDNIGFKRGTDAHANCILSQHQHNQRQMMQALPLLIQHQQQQEAARKRTVQPYKPSPMYNTDCYTSFGRTNCTTTGF